MLSARHSTHLLYYVHQMYSQLNFEYLVPARKDDKFMCGQPTIDSGRTPLCLEESVTISRVIFAINCIACMAMESTYTKHTHKKEEKEGTSRHHHHCWRTHKKCTISHLLSNHHHHCQQGFILSKP